MVDLLTDSPILLLALATAAVYMISCVVHPYRVCKTCNRSKETHSSTFKGAFGPCRSCQGRGHHLRFGARILGRKL